MTYREALGMTKNGALGLPKRNRSGAFLPAAGSLGSRFARPADGE